jgi:LPS O-antigen subunit length determinant protein (WzzB/FepE family)
MEEMKPHYDDEIDLVELFQTVWDGKWNIIGAVVISVLGVFGYQSVQPPPNFEATTEIKPISSVEAEQYRQSNALGFFEVSPATLLNLYIEQLEERELFEEAIRQYELLDASNYEDEALFNEAVIALAASIEILPPINADDTDRGEVRRFWTISFEHNDVNKWKQVLASVDTFANQSVKKILQQRFQTALSVAMQKRNFEIEDIQTQMTNAKRDFDKDMEEFEQKQTFQLEDIDTQIANAKRDFDREMEEFEQKQTFQLEDIDTQIANARRDFDKEMEEFELTHQFAIEDVEILIANALADYDRKTADRLAFLKEQAAIARKLGVAKNTIEAQMFNAQNGIVANVKTDTPFYLRGYEAIEKEIELIETRDDKKAFVSGLFELEQKKRELQQDKTIQRAEMRKVYLDSLLDLEKQKRQLEQDKTLERAELNQKFADSLLALQDKKRELEQDKTLQRAEKNKLFLDALIELEKQQRAKEQNKTLERAEALFALTPVIRAENFAAVSVTVEATNFETQNKRMLMLALAVVIGGMVGVLYVLISSAVRKRKQTCALND